jgi:beta-glucosidase
MHPIKGSEMKSTLFALGLLSTVANAQLPQEPFQWGAASAAYQVEGATAADGKGQSIWDVYLDKHELAGKGITGATAINFYDRTQYLKDITLFKQLGLTTYRFSISWPRIIPDGTGEISKAGVDHYRQFIADLKAAGIKPMLTLYHWDMPAPLAAQGGWTNRDSVQWFKHYADAIFDNFSDQVDLFVLVNEPSVERATQTMAEERMAGASGTLAIVPDKSHLATALKSFNHILLASAAAKRSFEAKGYKGQLGLAVPLFPTLTIANATKHDKMDATSTDGVLNRWFLDAMYKGTYPADILKIVKDNDLDIDVQAEDAKKIHAAHFDFLGINYYAPLYIKHKVDGASDYAPEMYLQASEKNAFNGAVRPDQFKSLLERMKTEYGNPTIFITENGAGFANEDILFDGKVRDINRCQYLVEHIAAMKSAIKEGVAVQGYYVWSSHDNLEWLSGYSSRFGMIYVDYATQKRIPKLSAEVYSQIIKGEPVTTGQCSK